MMFFYVDMCYFMLYYIYMKCAALLMNTILQKDKDKMATRGIYKFKNTDNKVEAIIYIHHDNYKEGAAQYLYNMLDHKGNASFLSTLNNNINFHTFMRANKGAEIITTEDIDIEMSQEYEYTIYDNGVLEIKTINFEDKENSELEVTNLQGFINEYGTNKSNKVVHVLPGKDLGFIADENIYITPGLLKKYAQDLGFQLLTFNEDNPNYERVRKLLLVLNKSYQYFGFKVMYAVNEEQ